MSVLGGATDALSTMPIEQPQGIRTEMMIHKGHLGGGAIPDLFTFPRAWVCFECGCSTFTLAQNELLSLREAMLQVSANVLEA